MLAACVRYPRADRCSAMAAVVRVCDAEVVHLDRAIILTGQSSHALYHTIFESIPRLEGAADWIVCLQLMPQR